MSQRVRVWFAAGADTVELCQLPLSMLGAAIQPRVPIE